MLFTDCHQFLTIDFIQTQFKKYLGLSMIALILRACK